MILFYLMFYLFCGTKSDRNIHMIKVGGYSTKICMNESYNDVNIKNFLDGSPVINCSNSNKTCHNGYIYYCQIPCGYEFGSRVKVKNNDYQLNMRDKPIFKLSIFGLKWKTDQDFTIYTESESLSLLDQDQIHFIFSHNISCFNKSIVTKSIICRLNVSYFEYYKIKRMNVSVRIGLECNEPQFLGEFSIEYVTKRNTFIISGLISVIAVVFIVVSILIVIKNNSNKKKSMVAMGYKQKELEAREIKQTHVQKRAFLEYQNAVKSFNNLGTLTPRHMLSFYDYVSRILNVEFTSKREIKSENSAEFESVLLNQTQLIDWIDKMEKSCRAQERSLVASLLTLVLFQHPKYFLNLLKCMLTKLIEQMKSNSTEKLLFRNSDSIIEKLVGNWITICMYQNMRTGEIGKRFFNLYRAIKCKMDSGLVDTYIKKAKYALSPDFVMLGDMDYEVLNIVATVQIFVGMVDGVQNPLALCQSNLQVEVLSLDSISQVKEKIIDKAIMVQAEAENLDFSNNLMSLAIAKIDPKEYNLHFVSNTTKILLSDFDRTSIKTDKEYTIVNTMKHYSMRTGMNFLLTSIPVAGSCFEQIANMPKKIVHLQMPNDFKFGSFDQNKSSSNLNTNSNIKSPISPIIHEGNKESYLMHLLAIKKSLSPFIDGFVQWVLNWRSVECVKTSSNSLFEQQSESHLSVNLLDNSCGSRFDVIASHHLYLAPTFYLFSILEEIGKSLSITDEDTIKIWKSNSFILRFWVNLIKNPNFVFSIDKTEILDGSLTTIASVLMESCSVRSTNVDINSPIIKQLFLEEVKDKYSSWWQSFLNHKYSIDENDVLSIMDDIVEKYQMKDHLNSSLRSLQAIANSSSMK